MIMTPLLNDSCTSLVCLSYSSILSTIPQPFSYTPLLRTQGSWLVLNLCNHCQWKEGPPSIDSDSHLIYFCLFSFLSLFPLPFPSVPTSLSFPLSLRPYLPLLSPFPPLLSPLSFPLSLLSYPPSPFPFPSAPAPSPFSLFPFSSAP